MSKKKNAENKPVENQETGDKKSNKDIEEDQKELKPFDVFRPMIDAYSGEGNDSIIPHFHKRFREYLIQEFSKSGLSKKYNLLCLFDDSTMLKSDADNIYNAATTFKKDKPILLILYSGGGVPGSAYLIGKLCREYSNGKLVVAIPRYAKSAATLLCCAANEIHMGSLSELGPIDPQINNMPTLGLKNSIEHIAELVTENPTSSDMFAKYMHLSIEPIQIGYYERVAESAMQYAENLLNTHKENLPKAANLIANELVYKYKDHGFVIDKSEATKILGEEIIKSNTKEYEIGNTIYQFLDTLSRVANFLNHNFYFIGGLNSEPTMNQKKNK
jgi:hypothetical protein